MSLSEYQATRIGRSTSTREGSFENLIKDGLYDIGMGFAGVAITEWFPRSPKTIFVGMDLAGNTSRDDQIVGAYIRAIKKLDGYVAEMLDLYSYELTKNSIDSTKLFVIFYMERFLSFKCLHSSRRIGGNQKKCSP